MAHFGVGFLFFDLRAGPRQPSVEPVNHAQVDIETMVRGVKLVAFARVDYHRGWHIEGLQRMPKLK